MKIMAAPHNVRTTTSAVATQKNRFDFFRLPRELRDVIYDYSLIDITALDAEANPVAILLNAPRRTHFDSITSSRTSMRSVPSTYTEGRNP